MRATFPLGPFTPHPENPVLRPQGEGWESTSVRNPAALVVDDRVVLLYGAVGPDAVSRLGRASSADGIHFERETDPVLSPVEGYEARGIEDPRISLIDGTYYLTYTGFDGASPRLCLATSPDLREWTRHGPIFPAFNTWAPLAYGPDQAWSRAGVIAPAPIDGTYHLYFGEGTIHHATSTDLLHWTAGDPLAPLYAPTPGSWDGTVVQIGAPPVTTDEGLMVLLINSASGTSLQNVEYRAGQLAIARSAPDRVLAKMTVPWLAPQSFDDTAGSAPNVTFVEGLVAFHDAWFAYFGQSDNTLGVAVFDPATDRWG